jgi:hypothetical protein
VSSTHKRKKKREKNTFAPEKGVTPGQRLEGGFFV